MKKLNELKVNDVVQDRNGSEMIIREIRDANSITCQEFNYDTEDFDGDVLYHITVHDIF